MGSYGQVGVTTITGRDAMNICGLPPDRKQRVWANIKEQQPDIATFITEVVQAFTGKYRVIEVWRR